MAKANVFFVAMLLGVAAALGTSAALRTVHLGAAAAAKSSALPDRMIASRFARLHRAEVSLKRALAKRPPKLPRVPHYPPVPAAPPAAAAPAPVAAAAPHVRYYRPPPIVIHKHRAGGESEQDGHDGEGGGDGGD